MADNSVAQGGAPPRSFASTLEGHLKTEEIGGQGVVMVPIMKGNVHRVCELFAESFDREPLIGYISWERRRKRPPSSKVKRGGFMSELSEWEDSQSASDALREKYNTPF